MAERTASQIPKPLAGAVIFLLGVLIVWLLSFSPWKLVPFAVAGQAYLLIAVVLAFRYWPPMACFVGSIPVPHRMVFGALIGAMILGHFTLNGRSYFPFVAWEIFPLERSDDPVTAREFIAVRADGSKVRLLVEQQFPSVVQAHPLEKYSPETLEGIANALARVYNAHHANNPVRQVDLMLMAVQLHPSPNEYRPEPSCELLKHYDISQDR